MKRSKLVLSICASVFCLALLVGGIWAAVTTSFSMNTTLVFKPEGVYVDIKGQIYRGASYLELNPLPEDELGEYPIHRNYEIDTETGKPTGNLPIDTWNIDEVLFLPLEKVIQFRIWVTNKGDQQITVVPMNDVSIANATVSEEASATLAIPAGETREYKITFTAGSQNINKAIFEQSFQIASTAEIETPEEYFTMDSSTPTQLNSINSGYTTTKFGQRIVVVPSTIGGNDVLTTKSSESGGTYCFSNLQAATKYVILPTTLTQIGNHTFHSVKSLSSAVIPSGVVSIGDSAFDGCTSLTSITIPNSVTSLGNYAFYGCKSLTSAVISSGISSLLTQAFYNCASLISITIPSGVTNIVSSAFSGCSSLMITVDSANPNYSSLGGSLYNKNKTTLIRGAGKAIIDDIPSSVTSIESGAFSGCTSLKYIKMRGQTLRSAYTLPTISGKVWVTSTSADKPANWTNNVVTSIPTAAGNIYYHQQAAWEN